MVYFKTDVFKEGKLFVGVCGLYAWLVCSSFVDGVFWKEGVFGSFF